MKYLFIKTAFRKTDPDWSYHELLRFFWALSKPLGIAHVLKWPVKYLHTYRSFDSQKFLCFKKII